MVSSQSCCLSVDSCTTYPSCPVEVGAVSILLRQASRAPAARRPQISAGGFCPSLRATREEAVLTTLLAAANSSCAKICEGGRALTKPPFHFFAYFHCCLSILSVRFLPYWETFSELLLCTLGYLAVFPTFNTVRKLSTNTLLWGQKRPPSTLKHPSVLKQGREKNQQWKWKNVGPFAFSLYDRLDFSRSQCFREIRRYSFNFSDILTPWVLQVDFVTSP